MPDYKNTVTVEGRSQGLNQVAQEAQRLNRDLARSSNEQAQAMVRNERQMGRVAQALRALGLRSPMGKLSEEARAYMKQMDALEGRLGDIAGEQMRLVKALGAVEEGTEAYAQFERELKSTERESRNVERQIRLMTQLHKDEASAVRQVRQEMQQMQGAFRQGFMQGAVQMPFLQRGPGAARQAMGMIAGRGVRGAAGAPIAAGRAAMGAAFTGVGGLAQGLAGIPVVGAAAAGQLQTAAGYAQQALGFEQQMMAAAPYLGLQGADPRAVSRARRQAMARMGTTGDITYVDAARVDAEVARRKAASLTVGGAGRAAAMGAMGGGMSTAIAFRAEREAQDARATPEAVRRDLLAQQREAGNRAGSRAAAQVRARSSMGQFRRALAGQGTRLGMNQQEMMQVLSQTAQIGGGTAADIQAQGMMGRAGAAARFGLDPSVAGAFMQGGRRGGLVGGQGRGGAAMEEAFANAMRMGLEGSELNEHMAAVAQGIQSWKQTGIPINEQSVSRLGAGMADLGMGGVRGGAVARGVQQYGQRLAQQGPQGGVDILALQTLGGVTGKGGLAEYVQGMRRLEEMDFGPEQVQKLFEAYTRAGAGGGPQTDETRAAGALTFKRAMGRMGVQMGFGEIELLQARQRGETLTAEQNAQLERALGSRAAGEGRAAGMAARGGMVGAAEAMVPAAVRRQAAIADRQLRAGRRMLTTVQNMESAATTMTGVFTKTVGPTVQNFSGWIEEATKAVDGFVTNMTAATDVAGRMSELTLGPR